MKRVFRNFGLAACAAVLLAQGASADTPPEHPILLKAAHIFDSVSGKLASPGMVLVRGKTIEAAGSAITAPADAKIVDLGDATLMPGFIDAHVHVAGEGSDDWYKDFFAGIMRPPAEQALYGAKYAKAQIEAGFTTVRDLGSNDYVATGLRNGINDGIIVGPRILSSNYAIGATGGHADQDPMRPDLVAQAKPINGICNSPDECRAAVRYQIKYGADVIKFIASGGVLSLADPVDTVELTQEEMNAIVSEAHAWHRKAAAHCHGDLAAKMAIKAGVDSIEHGSFLTDETLTMMKQKGTYLVPTLFATYYLLQHIDSFPAAIQVKARAAAAAAQTMFSHAVKIGTKVAFGTDAGVEPHGQGAVEFSLMTKNGMAPAQALMAATAYGADLLGVKDSTGTLEKGKAADIVALPGNPLEDIKATEHPKMVMRAGKMVVGG